MTNFSTQKDRILQFIEYKGISKNKFYIETGISNGVLDKKSGLSMETVEKFYSTYPEINAEWLLTGKGEMLKSEVKEQSKRKSNYTKEELQAMVLGELKIPKNNNFDRQTQQVEAFSSPKGVPLLPFDAFAGIGDDVAGVNFDTIEERYVIPLFEGLKVDFMIPVRGSSMYPKYSSGDVVACTLVTEVLYIQWNKVYVLDTKSQGVIMKRIKQSKNPKKLICVSDNKDYDPFEIPLSDIRNIALVVGVIRLE